MYIQVETNIFSLTGLAILAIAVISAMGLLVPLNSLLNTEQFLIV